MMIWKFPLSITHWLSDLTAADTDRLGPCASEADALARQQRRAASEVNDRLARIEAKLDLLIASLADETETEQTLDGDRMPGERDQAQEL